MFPARVNYAAALAFVSLACAPASSSSRGTESTSASTATATTTTTTTTTTKTASASKDPDIVGADLARIDGSPSAKLWVVVVSDFQCPYCKQWHDETYPAFHREYV